MPSVLVGVSPPTEGVFEFITAHVKIIEGSPVTWSNKYSFAEDKDRNNAITLLISATLTDPDDENDDDGGEMQGNNVAVTAEAVVAAVEQLLNSSKDEEESPPPPRPLPTPTPEEKYFCELWASSPVPLPLRPPEGYNDIINNVREGEQWEHQAPEIMREYGIVAQHNILDVNKVSELRQIVDKAISNVEAALRKHRPELNIGEDWFIFKEIASRNKQRFDLRLDTVPSAVEFVEKYIMDNPQVQVLLRAVLSDLEEVDFDISVVYSRPGAITQGWHADGSHQKQGGGTAVNEAAYALCLFIPLIDLNEEVGYTQFWPGSHRHAELVGFGQIAELTKATYNGICNAGSGVWYDYRLLHQGMLNVSEVVRPVVQVIFKQKWYVERANYGKESIAKE